MRVVRGVVAVVVAAALVSACSDGESEPEAAATTSVSPTPSPTPTVPPQEPTKYGTSAIISNWDEYYDDPVVQAYREFRAAGAATTNEKKVVPELEESTTSEFLDRVVPNFRNAWSKDWTNAPEARARIVSTNIDGSEGRIDVCEVNPSVALRDSDGNFIAPEDASGSYLARFRFVKQEGLWLVDDYKNVRDTCE